MLDTIIIGKGPAGISAAIYLKRFNLNITVIGKDCGALESKATIENYYGIESIDGKQLIQQGIEQAKKLGIDVIEDEVLDITVGDHFEVKTIATTYQAKTVFIATGKNRTKLIAKNLALFEGKGISYCVTCDGFFFRKKKIAIVGNDSYMLNELSHLENFSKDIIIFTDGKSIVENRDYPVVTEKITEFRGNEKLEEIVCGEKSYKVDGCFIAAGSASALDFAYHLGLQVDLKKNIIVDSKGMTNIKGIFAGGDVTGGLLQVIKAASDGANAAVAIKEYLKE